MNRSEPIRRKLLNEIEELANGGSWEKIYEQWLISQPIGVRKFIYKELDQNTLPLPDGKTDIYDCIKNLKDHIAKHYKPFGE